MEDTENLDLIFGKASFTGQDEDISKALTDILTAEGLQIFTNATAIKFSRDPDGITATIIIDGVQKEMKFSHILGATGRAPVTEELSLPHSGIELDEKGFIKVNAKLETNVKGIYALGDVNGGPAFTHTAYNDYTIVYRNLFKGGDYHTSERPVPYCMFTDPQLGRVGLTEKQALEKGYKIRVAKLPMSGVARAVETGDARGFMKAIVDADTGQILGAAILGQEAGEIITVLQMAMAGRIDYMQLKYFIFAHPTFSESLNNLFMKLEA